MYKKIFTKEGKVVQWATISNKDVQCEFKGSDAHIFIEESKLDESSLILGYTVVENDNGTYTFVAPEPEPEVPAPLLSYITWEEHLAQQQENSIRDITMVIKQYRNYLLTAVDQRLYSSTITLTATQKKNIAAYKQLLRDIPQSAGWPDQVTWPVWPFK